MAKKSKSIKTNAAGSGSSRKSDHSKRIAVGAGILTAATLAGAAGYLLSGTEGKVRRAKMKTWAVKAQKEVAQKVKKARELGEGEYKVIVDEAVRRYGKIGDVDMKEVMAVAKELKGDWDRFQKHAKSVQKIVQKRKSGTLKKAAKPSRKKTVKK